MNPDGCLYLAEVMHRRHVAPRYRFRYRLWYLLVDVDRLDALAARLRWFSHNRRNLAALHDCDHGDRARGGLRRWAERQLDAAGLVPDGGRIRLLCLPRVFGHAFNPLSLWYCETRDGRLRAVIAEVRNTFGERHSYLLRAPAGDAGALLRCDKDKTFHVSPFMAMGGRYRFALSAPDTQLRVHIRETDGERPLFDAVLVARQQPLDDTHLLRAVWLRPWNTAQVLIAIHWQALRIWLRGARVHRKPPPPHTELS